MRSLGWRLGSVTPRPGLRAAVAEEGPEGLADLGRIVEPGHVAAVCEDAQVGIGQHPHHTLCVVDRALRVGTADHVEERLPNCTKLGRAQG